MNRRSFISGLAAVAAGVGVGTNNSHVYDFVEAVMAKHGYRWEPVLDARVAEKCLRAEVIRGYFRAGLYKSFVQRDNLRLLEITSARWEENHPLHPLPL